MNLGTDCWIAMMDARGAPLDQLRPLRCTRSKVGNLARPSGTLWRQALRTFSESRGTGIYLALSCPIGKQNIVYQPRRAKRCDSSGLESPGGGTGWGFIREWLEEYTSMVIGVHGLERNVDYPGLSE
ncbi:hypothetical protein K0M31_000155 [Melipona bicolor]|uniref:Uncharacterized protein n=1 Tax=Melipona bicolor TaxID=60889 RepID=A0AA40GCX7_9HYME|nr:hypothetical protein K0M31_000155 [Melipona bicolor]